jgi:hypothetical protein
VGLGDLIMYSVSDGEAFSYRKTSVYLVVDKITDKSLLGVKTDDAGIPQRTWDDKVERGRVSINRVLNGGNGYGYSEDKVFLVARRPEIVGIRAEAEAERKEREARSRRIAALRGAAEGRSADYRTWRTGALGAISQARYALWEAFCASPEGQALVAAQNEAAVQASDAYVAEHPMVTGWALVREGSTVADTGMVFATEAEAQEFLALAPAYGKYAVVPLTGVEVPQREHPYTGGLLH